MMVVVVMNDEVSEARMEELQLTLLVPVNSKKGKVFD